MIRGARLPGLAQRHIVVARQEGFSPRYLATKSPSSSSPSGTSGSNGTNNTSTSSNGNSSTTGAPTKGNKGKPRDWFIVGASGSIAVYGAWWYLQTYSGKSSTATSTQALDQQQRSFSLTSQPRTSFSIPVRKSSDRSQSESKIITLLSTEEVDSRLRENEKSTKVERPAGACIVEKYETNSLASNDPLEDRRAEVIVERDRAVEGLTALQKGDLGFFAVMDGHAGWDTSTLLSNKVCT
jgi:pyruvate dehydrogenase phosphatase